MSAAVCYFLVYFAEALILLQYSSNVFEYKISSIKRYILLTVLFIPIYFISFAHIGLLNTALFFVATFVFLKMSRYFVTVLRRGLLPRRRRWPAGCSALQSEKIYRNPPIRTRYSLH